jgi:phosphoglycolate phosphatase
MIANGNVKAIVFDYDGVLVDSVHTGFEAYKRIAQRLQLVPYGSITDFKKDHARPYAEVFADWGIKGSQIDVAGQIFYKTVEELQHTVGFLPSIEKIIRKLSQRFRLGIVSGNKRSIIEKHLKNSPIYNCFETIIGSEDVRGIKPSPDGLHLCMKRFGLQKDEIYFVGDMVSDVMQGRNAGVQTVIIHGYSWNLKENLEENNPDILIEKPEELLTLFNGVRK